MEGKATRLAGGVDIYTYKCPTPLKALNDSTNISNQMTNKVVFKPLCQGSK